MVRDQSYPQRSGVMKGHGYDTNSVKPLTLKVLITVLVAPYLLSTTDLGQQHFSAPDHC